MGSPLSTPLPKNDTKKSPSPATMKNFDISKYLGTWYEIAHTKGSDGSQCENAIASYTSTQIPEMYRVTNTCYEGSKKIGSYGGTLKINDPNSPARLKLQFDGFLKSEFDYWVYWTDYNYALVGSSSGHFWVLSRTPQIGLCIFKSLIEKATNLGLGVQKEIVQDFQSLRDCNATDLTTVNAIGA